MTALQAGAQRLVAPYPEALLMPHVLPPDLCCAKHPPHSCCPPDSDCHQWGTLRPLKIAKHFMEKADGELDGGI